MNRHQRRACIRDARIDPVVAHHRSHGVVRLRHFTFVDHLFPILGLDKRYPREGIKPSLQDFMTGDEPAVWLTSRDSLMPTQADLDWLATGGAPALSPPQIADYRERGILGDRTAMLTVELSQISKRLSNYGAWLRKNVCDPEGALQTLSPSARTDWWIYFGTISADRITSYEWTNAPSVNEAEDQLKAAIDAAFGVVGSRATTADGQVSSAPIGSSTTSALMIAA